MSALRFEDRGLTLRLFRNEQDMAANPLAKQPTRYSYGWIAKNPEGRWIDAYGPLPLTWKPSPEHMEAGE